VQESGAVSLPSIPAAPAQSQGLCMGASGQLGPCVGGTGNTYAAGTGLTLSSTTFSVAPTYQLPQTCKANEVAQWNGTAWGCGAASGGVTLPPGNVNDTLRYYANNTLIANERLQAFDNGSLVASGNLNVFDTGLSVSGPGTRLMWLPPKAAFRAGSVPGAEWNLANTGRYSVAMGYGTTASADSSTATGYGTTASADSSTAMGISTTASGTISTAMGAYTKATGAYGTTAMGWYSIASGATSTAMGDQTIANGENSIAMGYKTRTDGYASTAMGSQTTASGKNAVAMGDSTFADADNSIAIGSNVGSGGSSGSFIFGDASRTSGIVNSAANQFMAIANGGFVFVTSSDGSKGAVLPHNDTGWAPLSDRNEKTAVQPVDPREVLKKVVEMPLSTWQYKVPDADFRHMGPMAQDFYAAFHLGQSDKRISTIDADGVALAAIQGLNARLDDKDREMAQRDSQIDTLRDKLAAQEAEIAKQKTEIARQKTRVAELESLAGELAEVKSQLAALRVSRPSTVTVAAAVIPLSQERQLTNEPATSRSNSLR